MKVVSPTKKPIDQYRAPDRRLTEGGTWRRMIRPWDVVKIVRVGVHGKGSFKGDMVVRLKLVKGGSLVDYKEEDFLVLFEPIISVVMED